ncbi:MAG: Agmatine deiminase [Burkholderia sp.]|jgi:agmatine deiminase
MKRTAKTLFCLAASLVLGAVQPAAASGENPNMPEAQYFFPDESLPHEGTWLIWPHARTYGAKYAAAIEPIWVQMTLALHTGERVHIIARDEALRARVTKLLSEKGADLSKIDFLVAPSDDVWARDTGPMFVFDKANRLYIADFAFDGWGRKTPFANDDRIPRAVSKAIGVPRLDIPGFVLEGGAVELSPDGTLLATKSAVISKARNPGMPQAEAEAYLRRYLGAKRFIWLEGVTGEDITDAHIDGFARFYDADTLLTVPESDFFELYEHADPKDYEKLTAATNAAGKRYRIVEVPLTARNVKGLGYKGSYLNFYVGTKAVLLPVYGDRNDKKAEAILQGLYPGRRIVPINVAALYKNGGMLHCVTQQQPRSR